MSEFEKSSYLNPSLEDLLSQFYAQYPGGGVEEDFFDKLHAELKGYGKARKVFDHDEENSQET